MNHFAKKLLAAAALTAASIGAASAAVAPFTISVGSVTQTAGMTLSGASVMGTPVGSSFIRVFFGGFDNPVTANGGAPSPMNTAGHLYYDNGSLSVFSYATLANANNNTGGTKLFDANARSFTAGPAPGHTLRVTSDIDFANLVGTSFYDVVAGSGVLADALDTNTAGRQGLGVSAADLEVSTTFQTNKCDFTTNVCTDGAAILSGASVVPEPASLALTGLGLLGLAGLRRRKQST